MLVANLKNVSGSDSITKLIISGRTAVKDGIMTSTGENGTISMTIYPKGSPEKGLKYTFNVERPLNSLTIDNIAYADRYDVLNDKYYLYTNRIDFTGREVEFSISQDYHREGYVVLEIPYSAVASNEDEPTERGYAITSSPHGIAYASGDFLVFVPESEIGEGEEITEAKEWVQENHVSIVYALKTPREPKEVRGDTLQDSLRPSPSIESVPDFVDNGNGEIEIHALNTDGEGQNSTVIYDGILRALPDGTRDKFAYKQETEEAYIEKSVAEVKMDSLTWSYAGTSADNKTIFRARLDTSVDVSPNALWCTKFDYYDGITADEGVYLYGHSVYGCFVYLVIRNARIKDDVIQNIQSWIAENDMTLYYKMSSDQKIDLDFQKIEIYPIDTLLTVMCDVVPKVDTSYYLDTKSTRYNYIMLYDTIVSFKETYEFNSESNLNFGNTPSKSARLQIKNYDDNGDPILTDSIVDYKFNVIYEIEMNDGSIYELPSGIYDVYDAPKRYDMDMTISLNDEMVTLDRLYDSKLSYPATIRQQLEEISEIAHMPISDTLSSDILDIQVPRFDSTKTIRQYLGWIAELSPANVKIWYGEIFIDSLSTAPRQTLSLENIDDMAINDVVKITRVVYENGLQHIEYGNTEGSTLYIDSANPYFIYGDTERLVQRVFNWMNGFTITSFEYIDTPLGDPTIYLGQMISLVDNDVDKNPVYNTSILGYEIDFNGGFRIRYKSDASLKTQNTIVNTISTDSQVNTIRVNMDQIAAQMSIISEMANENRELIEQAELDITPSAIIQKVNSAIADGSSISTVTATLDKNGFTISGGALTITNKAGSRVFYGDTNGNLTIEGTIKATSGTIAGFTISGNDLIASNTLSQITFDNGGDGLKYGKMILNNSGLSFGGSSTAGTRGTYKVDGISYIPNANIVSQGFTISNDGVTDDSNIYIESSHGHIASSTIFNDIITGSSNMYIGSHGYIYKASSSSLRYKYDINYYTNKEYKNDDVEYVTMSYKTPVINTMSIGDFKEDMESVLKIPIVEFKYNRNYIDKADRYATLSEKERYIAGFIAEDVYKINPKLAVLDEDGKPETWNSNAIIPRMLYILQEQDKKIKELEKLVREQNLKNYDDTEEEV